MNMHTRIGGEIVAETLMKRKFNFEVGAEDQDVIDKLEAAPTYKDLIVKAVRQYREEDADG